MIESLDWPAITVAGGGWTLSAFFMWLVYRGRLAPRSTLDDVIHDRNEWRAESRIKDAQIAEKDEQLRHLREVGETTVAALTSMRRYAEKEAT